MKTKLHFGILVLLLAFIGRYIEQTNVPNQQVVIQFSDDNISIEAAEETIEVIFSKLESSGAEQIQIGQNENGQLKITYYSKANVNKIQSIFSNAEGFKLDYASDSNSSTDFPVHRTVKDFELNISEIQNSNPINWDFEGVEVVQLNQKSEFSYNLKVNTSSTLLNTVQSNGIQKVAIKVNTTVALAIDKLSFNIPEVRAGPIT